MWFLRLLFRGKRWLVTAPLLLAGGFVAWETLVYQWYRGVSDGQRTGMIVKVSNKGSPLCRYDSIEMRVGQQAGAAVMGSDSWEFTVDPEHRDLIAKLQEAEAKQQVVTVKYRQDSPDKDRKPVAPPNNLPWRYCVTTSYHAVDVIVK